MSNRTPQVPNTKHTIFDNLLKDQINEANSFGPGRDMLNKFLSDVSYAQTIGATDQDMPYVEAPRAIIEFYNKNNMKGFDQVGYSIFQGVKVYEEGKRLAAQEKEDMGMEEKVFGRK